MFSIHADAAHSPKRHLLLLKSLHHHLLHHYKTNKSKNISLWKPGIRLIVFNRKVKFENKFFVISHLSSSSVSLYTSSNFPGRGSSSPRTSSFSSFSPFSLSELSSACLGVSGFLGDFLSVLGFVSASSVFFFWFFFRSRSVRVSTTQIKSYQVKFTS